MVIMNGPSGGMPAEAILSADRQTFFLRSGDWSRTFPVSQLGAQLAFYRGLWARGGKDGQPGPYARFYQPCRDALEALARELREKQGDFLLSTEGALCQASDGECTG